MSCDSLNEDKSLIMIFENGKETKCFTREELFSSIEKEKCDHSSFLTLKHFPQYQLFQKYDKDGKCQYRPLNGSINDFSSYLLNIPKNFQNEANSPNKLGQGAYGKVFNYADSPIAIKKSKDSIFTVPSLIFEYNIVKNLNSKHIQKIHDIKIDKKGIAYLYLTKMKGDLVQRVREKSLPIKETFYQICKGIYTAHSHGILHLDLKFENILIDENENVQIADWGLSRYYPYMQAENYYDHNVVTQVYRAPEIIKGGRYGYSADIFSLGVMGTELYKGQVHSVIGNYFNIYPRPDDIRNFIYRQIYNGDLQMKTPMEVILNKDFVQDPVAYDLFSSMLSNIPSNRPTISQVLNHPYFDSIRDKFESKDSRPIELFPEITNEIILRNSPNISNEGYRGNDKTYYLTSISDIALKSKTKIQLFLAINLFTRLCNKFDIDFIRDNKIHLSCIILARILNFDINGYFEIGVDNLIRVLNALDFNLYGSLPLLYFSRRLNSQNTEKLFEYEISPHPEQSAYEIATVLFPQLVKRF